MLCVGLIHNTYQYTLFKFFFFSNHCQSVCESPPIQCLCLFWTYNYTQMHLPSNASVNLQIKLWYTLKSTFHDFMIQHLSNMWFFSNTIYTWNVYVLVNKNLCANLDMIKSEISHFSKHYHITRYKKKDSVFEGNRHSYIHGICKANYGWMGDYTY